MIRRKLSKKKTSSASKSSETFAEIYTYMASIIMSIGFIGSDNTYDKLFTKSWFIPILSAVIWYGLMISICKVNEKKHISDYINNIILFVWNCGFFSINIYIFVYNSQVANFIYTLISPMLLHRGKLAVERISTLITAMLLLVIPYLLTRLIMRRERRLN